jgi:DNA-binding LacI/PurR family transcriptional regulator
MKAANRADGVALTRRKSCRPPVKRDKLVRILRDQIVSGKIAPGERLPTHKELARRFDAESQTICDVMRVLGEDGFIETRRRLGSFVALHPPHLAQFAFAYPFNPDVMPSQFFRAIHDEAERWQNPERRVLSFYDIGEHWEEGGDYDRLLRMAQSHRLAGLIFAANPFALHYAKSPLVNMPGLPRASIQASPSDHGFSAVYPDTDAFLPKAFERLALRGCKRVAVVQIPAAGLSPVAELVRIPPLAAEYGLAVEPQWIQAVSPGAGPWLCQLGRLLMHGRPGERPDGLVIADDNLVPELTAGLAACGVRDLSVVAHTNFPYPTPSAIPVMRLGYDVAKLVELCMERIDQQRRGEKPPGMTLLPAVWEEEFSGQIGSSNGRA